MLSLILKLTLAPILVVLATVIARRLGDRVGGLLSGFPVIAAPIALIYSVEQGPVFAAEASSAAILGLVPSTVFSVVVAWAAARDSLIASLGLGTMAYALTLAVAVSFHPSISASAAVALLSIVVVYVFLKRLPRSGSRRNVGGDLLLWRVALTILLVLALTAAASQLSPHIAGLLIPIPIITAVMAGFTQVRSGGAAVRDLLQGLVLAYLSFLTFFVVLATELTRTVPIAAFAAATACSLLAWASLVIATRPSRN